jgi:hypothetical protein
MHRGYLYDLEELLLSCSDTISRVNLEEAVNAYRAGAFRSAIVSTWIAVYFDLTAKIRSLSLTGHEEALKWITHFDEKVDAYRAENPDTAQPFQAIERQILNDANEKFRLIGSIELTELKRLRSDRHRCAHPTMRTSQELFTPSPELVRTHIRAAVEYVLSKPAIQGQLAVDRSLDLLRDEGFPLSAVDAQEVLRTSYLHALNQAELSQLLNDLVEDLLSPQITGTQRIQRIGAIEGIRNLMPNEFQELFAHSVSSATASNTLDRWNVLTTLMRSKHWLIAFVGGLEKGRINQTLKDADVSDPHLQTLVINCLFLEPFQSAANQRLATFPLDILTRNREHIPRNVLLQEAAQRLVKSPGVDATYPIMTQLIEPHVFHLKSSQVKLILDAYKTNRHVRESYAAVPLLEKILQITPNRELGPRDLWLVMLDSVTNWNDQTKELIKEYVDLMLPEPEADLNDVPF